MSLITYKFLAALLILIVTLIAVIYPIKSRRFPAHNPVLELGDAFASGIFLGAALFHMLPDSINAFSVLLPNSHFPLAESFCAAGFLLLLFLERLSEFTHHSDHQHPHHVLPYMLAIILVVHSLVEGAALGVNSTFAQTLIIFIAIIAHKGSESFALAVVLNRSHLSLKGVLYTIAIFACMTPLGIALGAYVTEILHSQSGLLITALFNAFAAGTFLYMSTLHHINHHQQGHEGEGLLEFLFLLIGLVIMAAIAVWA